MKTQWRSSLERALSRYSFQNFEAYYEKKIERSFLAREGALDSSQEAVSEGLGLRIYGDRRRVYVSSSDLSEAGLDDLCRSAAEMLPLLELDPDDVLPLPPLQDKPLDLRNWDFQLGQVSSAQKIQYALELERSARATHSKIKHVRSAAYHETLREVVLWNSQQGIWQHEKSECALSLLAIAEQGGEAESGYEFAFSPFFSRLDPSGVGAAAARRAISALGGVTPQSQKLPVVFDPLVSCEFLEALASSFRGDEVYKGRSSLAGRLGQKVYSPLLTVVDDRGLQEGAASVPFDGEGYPARRLSLVENGEVQNFLMDHYYAKKMGSAGNGSCVRMGFDRPPAVGNSNLFILPGELSDEAIFAKFPKALWVTEVMGMHAIDSISGDFSVGVQGFEIHQGEVGRPVKKMALAGNLHKLFGDILAVGSHQRFYFAVGAPTLAFAELSVSGAA